MNMLSNGQTPNARHAAAAEPSAAAWMAVLSLAMGVFGLLTAEYLPASLLTPMAVDLGVSEALAGQAVTVTAIVAMVAGLVVPRLTRSLDRRVVLLAFTVLMIASNLLVALSSSLAVLLVMRILLGVALGGFWSMAAAVAMRLVPARLVPRALSIIFSGIAIGTVVSVPLGSYLGGLYGWRSAFMAAAGVGGLTLLFQLFTLPRMAPRAMMHTMSVVALLRRPEIGIGMFGCVLAHTGQYALFTYIRPALESVAHIDVNSLSLMLLGFGVANFIGTLLAGWLMERSLHATLVVMPALVGVAAFGMIVLPVQGAGLMLLVALWGLAFGGVPVAWSSWVARAVPDQAEKGGRHGRRGGAIVHRCRRCIGWHDVQVWWRHGRFHYCRRCDAVRCARHRFKSSGRTPAKWCDSWPGAAHLMDAACNICSRTDTMRCLPGTSPWRSLLEKICYA